MAASQEVSSSRRLALRSGGFMKIDTKDGIRRRYRQQIQQKQREASALSIEVGLDAEHELDVITLAETALALDTAIVLLDEAKMRLRQSATAS
jgi:hypothetical protein